MTHHTPLTAKEKQQRYRERLRSQGLRPVQIWVPNTKAPGFAAECQRQARLLNASSDDEAQDFIEHAADWSDE